MTIRICLAGATGWTGSALAKTILNSSEYKLTGAIARQAAGRDLGEALQLPHAGVRISGTLEEALRQPADVLVDYTAPGSVKERALAALDRDVRVVIGTSGLTAQDFTEIDRRARERKLGVIAAGNFSITAALAKYFALHAARYLPSWELLDYAHAGKPDAPSGTARELAEELAVVAQNRIDVPIAETHGTPEARGALIADTPVHSIRLPGYTLAFEALFGLPDERLTIRHDAGTSAGPYVSGTLLVVTKVMEITGLVRGLDRLLFGNDSAT
jgi:4-hydroxy-tetrahydrodipicolinate reductase